MKQALQHEIETIKDRIEYKKSEGYLLIMQEGLSRFQNSPDALGRQDQWQRIVSK